MGGVLVLGAFFVSERSTIANESASGTIVSSAPERSYIEESDRDNNGIPDWQETLAAQVVDAIRLPSTTPQGDTEPYVEPTTFTGKFAEAFLTDYLGGKPGGEALDEESKANLVANAVKSVEANTANKIYSLAEIIIVPDSSDALREYGNEMARIITTHSIVNENEAKILKRSLDQNDPKILEELEPIRQVYENILRDSLKVAAPSSIAENHAALLSSYAAIETDIVAMQSVYTDPLLTLARIQRYEFDAKELYTNIKSITTKLIASGVSYEKDEPGALIYVLDI
jgi:hypothetical protein